VIGHHGAPNEQAENTLPSMQAAIVDGANAVEVDLCVTADDVLVLWHDCDPDDPVALARETGAEGFLYVPDVPAIGSDFRRPVDELTLSEFRDNFGYSMLGDDVDPSARIPTFEEFLTWAGSEPLLEAVYLDIKLTPDQVGYVVPLVSQLSSDKSLQKVRFIVLSTHTEIVEPVEAERRRLGVDSPRVAYDSEDPGALDVTLAEGLRDMSIGLTPTRTWSGLVGEVADSVNARDSGKVDTVMVWTIDRETDLAELLYYSVDGIITNDAALLRRLWRAKL
jgi:glycerophosphoryl diester phosphodiesterase